MSGLVETAMLTIDNGELPALGYDTIDHETVPLDSNGYRGSSCNSSRSSTRAEVGGNDSMEQQQQQFPAHNECNHRENSIERCLGVGYGTTEMMQPPSSSKHE